MSKDINKLQKNIEKNKDTKQDRLNYARERYLKQSKMRNLKKLNPVGYLKDRRTVNKKRIQRIVAGESKNHKDRMLDKHSEDLAQKIKDRAKGKYEVGN